MKNKQKKENLVLLNKALIAAVILRSAYLLYKSYPSTAKTPGQAFVFVSIGILITAVFAYLVYRRFKWWYYTLAVFSGIGIFVILVDFARYRIKPDALALVFAVAVLGLCIYIINNYDKLKRIKKRIKKHHPK